MLLFLSLLALYFCARLECGPQPHTKQYLLNKDNPEKLYYESTKSVHHHCEKMSNSELRKLYPWITRNDQVEHILDTNNGPKELESCSKQIRGNLIIANGTWNNQVGQLCWKDVEQEKRLVYGNDIFDTAYNSVKICCESNSEYSHPIPNVPRPITPGPYSPSYEYNLSVLFCIIIFVFAVILISFSYFYLSTKKQQTNT